LRLALSWHSSLSPKAAAAAFNAFGFDSDRADLSHNRELMREAGCGRPFGSKFRDVKIQDFGKGRVAMPGGWVPVMRIITDEKSVYYVDQRYINGTCKKYVPEVIHHTMPSLTASQEIAPTTQDRETSSPAP